MNNIYDLEGNNREWTAQAANYATNRTLRGGIFKYVNEQSRYDAVASCSYTGPTSGVCYICTRVTLYL